MQESKSCALPLGDSPTMIVATATGWIQGFEPWASRATIWRANQLRYTHHRDVIVPFRALTSLAGTRMCSKGFEPPTHGLEGRCSIQLSYRLIRQRLPHQRGISYHRAFRNASTFFNFFQINFQYLFTPFSDCFFHPIRS